MLDLDEERGRHDDGRQCGQELVVLLITVSKEGIAKAVNINKLRLMIMFDGTEVIRNDIQQI